MSIFNAMKNVIFLDAGHDDVRDPGTITQYGRETDFNRAIRDELIPELERNGFEVQKIPDNLDLVQSIAWVNERVANIESGLAVAIHCNFGNGEGAESYYLADFPDSSGRIAKTLIDEFCKYTGIKNRGARPDTQARFGRLGWVRDTECWATLIEVGFLDNPIDVEKIKNYKKMAQGIARGLCAIFKLKYQDPPAEEESESREEIKAEIKRLVDLL